MDKIVVSLIDADTHSYDDQTCINSAVEKAIRMLDLPCDVISPGMTVLIKPNLVMDVNGNASTGTDCLYTQAAVVRPVLEWVFQQLQGKGIVIIGDAPMQECIFEKISGYSELVSEYQAKGLDIELVDFRELKSELIKGVHVSRIREKASGKIINLGQNSQFFGIEKARMKRARIANYDCRILNAHHHEDVHEYYISDYVLAADVIINMPKPKTHRKAGVTVSLKNFVGVNTRKEFLPHHIEGSSREGGDEYRDFSLVKSLKSRLLNVRNVCSAEKKYFTARLLNVLIKACYYFERLTGNRISDGSWYGNDTISRTVVDINRIVRYADKNGVMANQPQRAIITIADMIICGEKEGPLCPVPKELGLICAGTNLVIFDQIVCTMMGFDDDGIPTIRRAREANFIYPLIEKDMKYVIRSNMADYDGTTIDTVKAKPYARFEASSGWRGHIEL